MGWQQRAPPLSMTIASEGARIGDFETHLCFHGEL